MKRILVSYYWQILIITALLTFNVSNSNEADENISSKPSFNYTEFMINHLRSKGAAISQRRNHRIRPDPVEETSTQPSTVEAEDRIFFKPYHFPFWGLPYGITSPGGFFNPGLFPFVPGGPGFPPFDGIFGSPFGPGKFPGGGPTPFQGFGNSSMSTSTTATATATESTSTSAPPSDDAAKVSNDSSTEGRTKRYPRTPGYRRKKRRRRPCCYPTTTSAPEEDDHYYPEEESDEGYHEHDNYEAVMERPNYPKYMPTEPPAPPPSYHKPQYQYQNSYKEQQRPSSSYGTSDHGHGPQAYSIPMTPPKPKYRHQPNQSQSSPKYRQRPHHTYKTRRPNYDQPPEKKKRPPSNSQRYRSRPKPPPPDYPPRYSSEDLPPPYEEEHHYDYTHSYANEQQNKSPYYSSYWNPVTPPTTTTTTTVATYTTPAPYNLGHSPVILNVSPCQIYSLANLLSPQCSTSTPYTTTTQSPPQVTNSYDRSDSSSTITISLPYQYWLYPPPEYTTPRPQYSIPPSLLESVTPPPQYVTPPPPQAAYAAPPSVPQYVQAHPPTYATPPVSPALPNPASTYPGYYSLPPPPQQPPTASSTSAPHPQPLYVLFRPWMTPPAQYGQPIYSQQVPPPVPATATSGTDTKPQQIIYLLSPPHYPAVESPSHPPIYPVYPPELRNAPPPPPTQPTPTTETPPAQPQPVYIMYSPPHSSNEQAPPIIPNYANVKSEPEATTTTPPVQPIYIMYPPQTINDSPPPQYSETTSVKPPSSPQPIYVIYTPHTDGSPNAPPKNLPALYPEPSAQPIYPKAASQGNSELSPPAHVQQPVYVMYARPPEEKSTQDPPTYDKPPPSNYPVPVPPPQSDPETPPQKPVYAVYAHQPKTTTQSSTSSTISYQSEYIEPPPQTTYVKPTQFVYDEPPRSQQSENTPPEFTYSAPPSYNRFKYPAHYLQRPQSTYSKPPSPSPEAPPRPYEYSTPPPKPTLDTPPVQFTYSPTLETPPPLNTYLTSPLNPTLDTPPLPYTYSTPPPKPTLDTPPVQFTYSTPSQHTVDTPPETIYVRPTPKKSTYEDSHYLTPPPVTSPNQNDPQYSSDYDNIQNIHGPSQSQSQSLETPSPHYDQHDDDIYPRYPVYNFDTPMNHESTSPLKVYSAYGGSRPGPGTGSHVRTQPYPTANSTNPNRVSIVYPERSSPSNSYSQSLYPRGRKYPSVSEPHEINGFTFHQDPIPSESRTYPRTTGRRVKSRAYVFDDQINTDDDTQPQKVRGGLNIHLAPNSNVFLSSSSGLSVKSQNHNTDTAGALENESTSTPRIESLSSPFGNADADSEGQKVSKTSKSKQIKPGTSEETREDTTNVNVTVKPSNAHQYSLSS